MTRPIDYVTQDEILEREWQASYGDTGVDFIHDGMTDPDHWFCGRWKILAILKEAHGGGNWNHAAEIKKHGGLLRVGGSANQSTHNRMVEWIYAIESALDRHEICVGSDRANGYIEAKKSMLRAAWINIKKANGVSSSDWGDLHRVAQRDALFIKRQFNLIAPQVVLCCATFGVVRNILFPQAIKVQGSEFSYIHQNALIFECRHPARASGDYYKCLVAEIGRVFASGVVFKEGSFTSDISALQA